MTRKSRGPEAVLTIGVYGFDQEAFLRALRKARADLLIDIRARRGVRGREYAFANAARLQAMLAEAEIRYVHVPELAPSDATRQAQYRVDEKAGVSKRQRTELSPEFIRSFVRERLARFSSAALMKDAIREARRPVLLCVEREPGACHRSLVARRLSDDLGIPVEDLMP